MGGAGAVNMYLHICGDLGPTMLHLFINCPCIVGLVCVGCC